MYEIVEHPIDAAAVTAAVADAATGASVTFIGTTRDHNDGRRVTRLEYEAYPEMAIAEMRKIGATARERWPVARVAIVHRIGVVPIGEASVVIAVSAGHRVAAFEACHFAIDRLKEVVPIWKKEHFEGGEIWIGSQTGKRFESGSVVAEPTASSDGAAGLDRLKMDGRERDAVREFVARVHDLVGKNLVGVRLFGSYARGDHRPDSDIDIAVVVEGPLSAVEDAIYDAAFDVNLAREVFISPRVVQRSVFEDPVWRNTGFIRSLEKDGVPL